METSRFNELINGAEPLSNEYEKFIFKSEELAIGALLDIQKNAHMMNKRLKDLIAKVLEDKLSTLNNDQHLKSITDKLKK